MRFLRATFSPPSSQDPGSAPAKLNQLDAIIVPCTLWGYFGIQMNTVIAKMDTGCM